MALTYKISPDTGSSAVDQNTSGDANHTLLLSGTGTKGDTIAVSYVSPTTGSTATLTTTVGVSGKWSLTTPTLADGAYQFTVIEKTASGAIVAQLAASSIWTIDTQTFVTFSGTATTASAAGVFLTGTAEAFDSVKITYRNSKGSLVTVGTATADASGHWTLTAPLAAGNYAFTATATDRAGNSALANQSVTVVAAPTQTVTSIVVAGDNIVNQAEAAQATMPVRLVLSAPLSAGDQLIVTLGTQNYTGVKDASDATGKTYLASIPTAQTGGSVSAHVQNALGASGSTFTRPYTVDTVAPAAPTLAVLNDGGASVAISNDNTLHVAGTAEAGSVVTVTRTDPSGASSVLGTVTAAANGTWSLNTPALANGTHQFSAVARDAAGNLGPTSAVGSVTIDTSPPAAPTLVVRDDGGAAVALSGDNTLHLGGTAEAGSTVTVTWTNQSGTSSVLGTATAAANGVWSLDTPALADGTHQFSAVARDTAGNVGPASTLASVAVDTVAPAAPTLVVRDDGGATVALSNDNTLHLAGTAEAGSVVTVTWTNQSGATSVLGTATAAANGAWSLDTPALANGTHQFSAAARDAAGHVGPASVVSSVTIDTSPPAAPTLVVRDDGGAAVTLSGDNTLHLGGTAEAGSVVTVTWTNQAGASSVLGTATAGANGAWSLDTPTLADGTHQFSAVARDPAGNVGPVSTLASVAVDTVAPVAPTLAVRDDGGAAVALSNDNTLHLGGTAEAGSTVMVTWTDQLGASSVLGTAIAAANGVWSLDTPALADGTHQFSAVARDAAGNAGPASAMGSVVIDTAALGAPTLTVLDDAGAGATLSNDNTLHLTGTAEAGSIVTVTWTDQLGSSSVLGTATASANGVWSLDTGMLADGIHQFSAASRDIAGNGGPASPPVSVTVDTVAPTAPTLAVLDDAGAGVALSGDNTLHLGGIAEAGSVVTVSWTDQSGASSVLGTATAAADGVWSLDTPALGDGVHQFSAVARDAAGNVGPASTAGSVTVDTTAPTAPTLVVRDDANAGVSLSGDNTLHLGGTAEGGSAVTVTWTDQLGSSSELGTTTAAANGVWSLDTPALADGTHQFSAVAADAAGNEGPASAVGSVTIDTVAPEAPTLAVRGDSGASVTLSNDNTLHLGGTAEAGGAVTVTWTDQSGSSSVLGTAIAAANGAWSLDTAALLDGTHEFYAEAVDAAGNIGPASAEASVTVDTVAPAGPTSVAVAGDNVVDSLEAQQATVPVVIKVSQPLASGEVVTVTAGATNYTATLDSADLTGTTYKAAIASPQVAGSLTVRVQDAAGNVSAPFTQSYTYQNAAPHWDHIVVVVEENHTYSEIIGNPQASYINSLASQGALFTNFNAATNPSQANYLVMFSGSPQGVVDDDYHFFDAPTIAGQLQAVGESFAGYFDTGASQKHLPWLTFAESVNLGQNLSTFPGDFSQLPTLSFVIPNDANNMHDGTISTADTWLHTNLDQYAAWAQTHNSLLIVTFDEGSTGSNRIPTIVTGAGIAPQQNNQAMDHFGLLHTIESALGLSALGDSANTPVMTFSGLGALNNAPVAQGEAYYGIKDSSLTVATNAGLLANDSDRDGDALTTALVAGPSHGSLQLNANGSFSYTPSAGYVGADSFTYQATDGKNASAVATASLYVSATPVAQATFQQGVAGYTGVVDTMLRASAPNTGFGNATALSVDSNNPSGSGLADDVLIQFNNLFGTGANQIPLGSTIISATLTMDTAVRGSGADLHRMLTPWTDSATWNSMLNGIQANGSEASASIDAHLGPVIAHGATTVDVSSALQAWAGGAPNYGWAFTPLGSDEWRLNSSESATGPRLSVVYVAPVGNQAPLAAIDSYSTAQNTPLSVSAAAGVLANDRDFDGNSLNAALVSGPSHGSLLMNADGSFTYTPDASFGGTDSFVYKANDGQADSAATTVNIGIGKLTQHTVTLQQGTGGYADAHDTMARQDAPDSKYGTTAGLVIDSDDPAGSYHSSEALLRFDNLIGGGMSQVPVGAHVISATLTLQTTDTGSGGAFHNMLQAWSENDSWNTLVNGIQANGTEASTAVVASTGFVSALGATTLDVTSSVQAWAGGAANYGWAVLPLGSDGWRFGSDENVPSPSLTVTYEVYEGNHAPLAAADSYVTSKNAVLTVTAGTGVLVNDSDLDGDALGARLINGPAHGSIQFNTDGSFAYTPDANYAGPDSFTYVANDGLGDSAPTSVSFGVGTLTQFAVTLQQGVNGYTGVHDTMLRQDSPSTRSGTTTVLNIDTDDPAGTGFLKEVLLRFDNLVGTGTSQVPLGAHIVSATLSVQTTDTGSGGEFHRMLQTWSENDSWNTLVNGVQANGLEAAAGIDVRTGFVGSLGQTHVDVTSSVQAWADGAANHGWAVLPLGDDGWRFGSAEYTTPPSLSIVYDLYV